MTGRWIIALCVAWVLHGEIALARPWTNREGKVIEAEFIRCEGDYVVLLFRGKESKVTFAELSDADQAYIRERAAPQQSAEPSASSSPLPDLTQMRTWTTWNGQTFEGRLDDSSPSTVVRFRTAFPSTRASLRNLENTEYKQFYEIGERDRELIRRFIAAQNPAAAERMPPPLSEPPRDFRIWTFRERKGSSWTLEARFIDLDGEKLRLRHVRGLIDPSHTLSDFTTPDWDYVRQTLAAEGLGHKMPALLIAELQPWDVGPEGHRQRILARLEGAAPGVVHLTRMPPPGEALEKHILTIALASFSPENQQLIRQQLPAAAIPLIAGSDDQLTLATREWQIPDPNSPLQVDSGGRMMRSPRLVRIQGILEGMREDRVYIQGKEQSYSTYFIWLPPVEQEYVCRVVAHLGGERFRLAAVERPRPSPPRSSGVHGSMFRCGKCGGIIMNAHGITKCPYCRTRWDKVVDSSTGDTISEVVDSNAPPEMSLPVAWIVGALSVVVVVSAVIGLTMAVKAFAPGANHDSFGPYR